MLTHSTGDGPVQTILDGESTAQKGGLHRVKGVVPPNVCEDDVRRIKSWWLGRPSGECRAFLYWAPWHAEACTTEYLL